MKKKILTALLAGFVLWQCGSVGLNENVVYADEVNDYGTVVETGNCGATESDNVIWTIYDKEDDGVADTLLISGSGDMQEWGSNLWSEWSASISEVILQEGITRIGGYSFKGFNRLRSVNIPNTVNSIGIYAFSNCNTLSNVEMEESKTTPLTMESVVFNQCSILKKVIIPRYINSIGSGVFRQCPEELEVWGYNNSYMDMYCVMNEVSFVSIGEVLPYIYEEGECGENAKWKFETSGTLRISGTGKIWDYLSRVGDRNYAPWGDYKDVIKKIEIEEGITRIGTASFIYCKNVEEVQFPESVTEVGEDAFQRCYKINFELPSKLERIGEGAFASCNTVLEIELGENIAYIGNSAFGGCEKINSVKIYAQYIDFGTNIFYGCNALNVIYGYEGSDAEFIALNNEKNYIVMCRNHNIVIDSAIDATCHNDGKTEGSHCSVCGEVIVIQSIVPATGHTEVVDEAVEATCTEKGFLEGKHCSICGEVTKTQEEVPALGHTVVIDKAVEATETSSGLTEGSHCSVCNTVLVAQKVIPMLEKQPTTEAPTTEAPTTEGPSTEAPSTEKPSDTTGITPTKGTKVDVDNVTYKVTKAGSTGATVEYVAPKNTSSTTIKIPATVPVNGVTCKVTSIAANAFKNNKKIKKVVIGSNVTSIGSNAFSGCTKLTTVTIGKNVTSIGKKAFYKCTALKKITIPAKVTKIGTQAFAGDKKLKTIVIKTTKLSTAKIGKNAFKGIYSKATIKVPKSKLKAYKTMLIKRGVSKKATIKK